MQCPKCRKEMLPHDYEFMIRDTCHSCGYTHDTPKAGKEKEYDDWMRAKNEQLFRDIEDY